MITMQMSQENNYNFKVSVRTYPVFFENACCIDKNTIAVHRYDTHTVWLNKYKKNSLYRKITQHNIIAQNCHIVILSLGCILQTHYQIVIVTQAKTPINVNMQIHVPLYHPHHPQSSVIFSLLLSSLLCAWQIQDYSISCLNSDF